MYLFCMYMSAHDNVGGACLCGGQRTTLCCWFSPTFIWVLELVSRLAQQVPLPSLLAPILSYKGTSLRQEAPILVMYSPPKDPHPRYRAGEDFNVCI